MNMNMKFYLFKAIIPILVERILIKSNAFHKKI